MPVLPGEYNPPRRGVNAMRLHGPYRGYGGEMTNGISFDEWLSQTQARRDDLAEYARSPLPIGNDSHGEVNTLIAAEDDAQRLLADAQTYLTQATAVAVLFIKGKYPENSADERRILVKDAVRDIQRLVDGIEVTARAMSSRRFLSMNINRSR